MTRMTNARVAGTTFLLYIVTGITSMILFGQAVSGDGIAAKLAAIAQHQTLLRVTILLTLLQAGYALALGVTLYALTRDADPDLALMAMCCRLGEGLVILVAPVRTLSLLAVATGGVAADAAMANALGGLLLKAGGLGTIAAVCFGAGSALFSYLFLRARSIPAALAWLGLLASALWVVALPLQLAGLLGGPVTYLVWIPMFVFEVWLALWLLIKGVAPDRTLSASRGAGDSVRPPV
jgi:hypothetical protein